MKRITLITSTAATLLAVALLPAVASAESHHHRHHHRSAHARLQSFGTSSPTAPASDNAGTVTSFTRGVLTIKLTDGSSVAGKVTTATELKCETAPVSSMARMADRGGGEDSGASGESSSSGNDGHGSNDGQSQSGPTPVVESSDDNGQDANDADEPPAAGQPGEAHDTKGAACEMSSLKEGTTVRNAELAVTSTGATFLEVEIIL